MPFLCLCIASEHRKLVAAGLWQTGYHADWMCGMEGGRFSSRDLLLSLGWLLATGTLEKLLTQRVQQLDKKLLTPTPVSTTGIPQHYTGKPNSVFVLYICICTLLYLQLGEPSAFQWTPVRLGISEETSVAHWLSEIPGADPAVHARRANSLAPCCEKIPSFPTFLQATIVYLSVAAIENVV